MQRNETSHRNDLLNEIQFHLNNLKVYYSNKPIKQNCLERLTTKMEKVVDNLEKSHEEREREAQLAKAKINLQVSVRHFANALTSIMHCSKNKSEENLEFYRDSLKAVDECLNANKSTMMLHQLADKYKEYRTNTCMKLFSHRQSPVKEMKHLASVIHNVNKLKISHTSPRRNNWF